MKEIQKGLWILNVSGTAKKGEISLLLDCLISATQPKDDAHLILDIGDFKKFPLSERNQIFEAFIKIGNEDRINFFYIVGANPFIRMVAQIAKLLYSDVLHSFEKKVEDAIKKFEEVKVKGLDFKDEIDNIIKTKSSSKNIRLLEYEVYESKETDSMVQSFLFYPNILFNKYSGSIDLGASLHNLKLNQNWSKKYGKLHTIIDLQDTKANVTQEAKDHFNENIKELFNYAELQYYSLSSFYAVLFRVYTYINPSFRDKVKVVKSGEETVYKLLKSEEITNYYHSPEIVRKQLDESQLNALPKEELINYSKTLQSEFSDLQLKYHDHVKDVMSVMSKLTWDNDFKTTQLPELNEYDVFYELFNTVNLLQHDVGELIRALKQANIELEEGVEKRSKEIILKESNLRSLIENFTNPIWLIDKNYEVVEFNSLFYNNMIREYGVSLKKGVNILDVFPKEVSSFWKARYDKCLKGEVHSYIESYDFKNSPDLYFEVRTFPIYANDKISGVGVVSIDITDLQRSKNELEEKNTLLTKLNHELDSFIYRSSHDLRAPISSVKGLIQIALMEDDLEKKNHYLDLMNQSMDKLDGFIHEIMDITKNAKLEVLPIEISLFDMINKVLDELAHSDMVSGIKTIIDISPEFKLYCDESRLKTLLKNIIANSFKYRDKNKDSFVKISAEKDGNQNVIIIHDNGEGIRKEDIPKITNMFYRAHVEKSGSGLGLYIVSEIIAKIKGEIEIESDFGQFTKVTIKLP